jgi:hypothetical protein
MKKTLTFTILVLFGYGLLYSQISFNPFPERSNTGIYNRNKSQQNNEPNKIKTKELLKQKGLTNISEYIMGFGKHTPVMYIPFLDSGKQFERYFFQIQTIIGYQFNRNISLGVGIGLLKYAVFSSIEHAYLDRNYFLPLFIEERFILTKGNVAPFISLATGYRFAFAKHLDGEIVKGGILVEPTGGLKFFVSPKSAIQFGIGYRYAQYKRISFSDYGSHPYRNTYRILENAITIKLGVTF